MLQRFVRASRAACATRTLGAATTHAVAAVPIRVTGGARGLSVDAGAVAASPAAAAVPVVAAASSGSSVSPPSRPPRVSRVAHWEQFAPRPKKPYVDLRTWPTQESGERGTLEWRMHFVRTQTPTPNTTEKRATETSETAASEAPPPSASPVESRISPWHDIPLLVTSGAQYLRYVNEIPKGSRPKMEIATKEPNNPIKQDVKKGALRNFTYGDLPFNYGALPQTWENPNKAHVLTGKPGDNDPIDVVEVSETPIEVGGVRVVRVLGALALLDEGETDWKILAIDMKHPLAKRITHLETLEEHMPGKVAQIRDWFKMYKTTDGKPENEFAFNGEAQSAGVARGIIWETHHEWAKLARGVTANLGSLWKGPLTHTSAQLSSSKLLLKDLSWVGYSSFRKMLQDVLDMGAKGERDPILYKRLRHALERVTQIAAITPVEAVQMEPTLYAMRKAMRMFLQREVKAGEELPTDMPEATTTSNKSAQAEDNSGRTPKDADAAAAVPDRNSQQVSAMLDSRARGFMQMFDLMSREQTRTQVVYSQLASNYRSIVRKVDAEEAASVTLTSVSNSYVRDLRVLCRALRTYFIGRNVVTREAVPAVMPVIPARALAAADAESTPRKDKIVRTATIATAAGTIAKAPARERKTRETRETRKPREPRSSPKPTEVTSSDAAAVKSEKESEKAAAPEATPPPQESVEDLLANVMKKLNSSPN